MLCWIKAHVGTVGNEMADFQAREGAAGRGGERTLPVPLVEIKNRIAGEATEEWNSEWTAYNAARQTKQFLPFVIKEQRYY